MISSCMWYSMMYEKLSHSTVRICDTSFIYPMSYVYDPTNTITESEGEI